MSQNALLEEKIIRLVLSELGHPVEGERLFSIAGPLPYRRDYAA
jgi:hypothetical protein